MQNRLKFLYEQYMSEKECCYDECCSSKHQHMMKNLAMEMAAVEFLMKSDIKEHIGCVEYAQETTQDRLTACEADNWVNCMVMPNGSKGAKWDMATTTAVAKQHGVKFEHITEYEWYAVLNMMYSDYYDQAKTGKPDEVPHYVKLAKDFLFDEDGKKPHEKVYCYWKYVVKH